VAVLAFAASIGSAGASIINISSNFTFNSGGTDMTASPNGTSDTISQPAIVQGYNGPTPLGVGTLLSNTDLGASGDFTASVTQSVQYYAQGLEIAAFAVGFGKGGETVQSVLLNDPSPNPPFWQASFTPPGTYCTQPPCPANYKAGISFLNAQVTLTATLSVQRIGNTVTLAFDGIPELSSTDPAYGGAPIFELYFENPGGDTNQGGATWSNFTVTTGSTPLPATLPLFATGLGAMGLFGWRRKRKAGATFATA